MGKKHLSLIIVPHSKTSTRTVTFSRKTLKALAFGGGVAVLALLVILVDYVSMSGLRGKFKDLSSATAEQTQKITDYEKSIAELQARIANFEEYAKKLNVMAGLKSPDVLPGPAGLGGGPSDDSNGDDAAEGGEPPDFPMNAVQDLGHKALSVESNLNTLVNYFESKTLELASTPSIMPTAGWMSSDYGYRPDPFTGVKTFHWGVDISTNEGNPIFTTADGIVLKVQTDKYLGRYMTISHGFGYMTVYGHMKEFAVRTGQRVKRGDVIGYVGKTGKAVGPHVHYEVRKDGKRVNPYHFLLEE